MQNLSHSKQDSDFMRIQDLLSLCLAKWRWFVISFIVVLGTAILYLAVTPPVYTRSASILIKEDRKGNSLPGELNSFADMGLFQTNTNVNNELISLQSPAVALEVVKRLHLETSYHIDGRFHKEVLYGRNLPVSVLFHELADNESGAFTLNMQPDGSIQLSDFTRNGEDADAPGEYTGHPGDTLHTPLGKITVHRIAYHTGELPQDIYVSRSSLNAATTYCIQNLTTTLADEKSTVITLSYRDVSTQRAEDVLNTLIAVYNENWMKDKNQIAISTSRFINERLGVIEHELGNVDDNISSYKSEHLLPDVQAASNMYMSQVNEANSQILKLNNQLSMARYIRNYLTDNINKNQLLPANSGIDNANIERQITEYNSRQLQRNSLIANSSEQNPLVIDLDHALASMRKAIVTSIDNQLVTLTTQISNQQKNERQNIARIAANPTQAKYLLSVERQQKVKEALYLFLLQKREENELSQAFTAYNTRIITPPYGNPKPTSPVKKNILAVALALGLLIPVIIIFIKENMDNSVRGKKDLESMTLPFIGEIPLVYHKKKYQAFHKRKRQKLAIVVKEKSRNAVNEAFRVARTNLEFMSGKEHKLQVIMLASINPDSGKTFISMNLATSLAVKGEKVLTIDLDLRKASLSAYINSPRTGISDYLGEKTDTHADIIVKGVNHPNLDILPVGTIPPNPTELLFSERLAQLLEHLRKEYDYILIDCPPAEIVADASIINKLSDMTLFIIRAGLLDRTMLPEIEKLHTEHKYKNMCLVLNGTLAGYGRYGYHKYGYRYGYHYGYGEYIQEEK